MRGASIMSLLDKASHEWEQLFTQFKNTDGDEVVCMVHKRTKQSVYFDAQQNRLLSKNEARKFTIDLTGKHAIASEGNHNPLNRG
jgi:hypothetical protein